MSDLTSSKNMAGIGTILLMLSSIPAAGTIVGIVGLILLLLGIKGLSEYYQDNTIYSNAIRGVIFFVIGLIAAAVVGGSLFMSFSLVPSIGVGGAFLNVIGLILAIVLLFVFYLLAAMYFRRAFSSLAQKTGEHLFDTAGLLLFIGAVLTIILIGLALILVAWILATIAFFSIRTSQPYGPTPQYAAPSQSTPTQYCPNCGAPVQPGAVFCAHCGKPLPP